jgi:hypothetical protein
MIRKKFILLFFLSFILSLVFFKVAFASASLFYKEVNLIGGYSDRERWIGEGSDLVNSVGFEDYRKFSGESGDYLTTDLQARVGYDSLKNSEDAWGLQIHNAWLLYKLNSDAKIRIGHFDPAFGLEPQLDTHGTILQTLATKDIGFKKDWGVGLEGSLLRYDYKTALQLGSGMSIYRKDGNLFFTSRIGTPTTQNFQYGTSFLYGKVLETMGMNTWPRDTLLSDKAVLKKRVGLDSQYLIGPYLLKGEVAYGMNNHTSVLGYLGEVDYTLPKYQNLELELQFQSWINNLSQKSSDDSTLTLGASYRLNQSTTLRAAFSHDFNMTNQKEEDKFLVQFYFFGA